LTESVDEPTRFDAILPFEPKDALEVARHRTQKAAIHPDRWIGEALCTRVQ